MKFNSFGADIVNFDWLIDLDIQWAWWMYTVGVVCTRGCDVSTRWGNYPIRPNRGRLIDLLKRNFYHKLWFSNTYNFATRCRRHFVFQTMNSAQIIYVLNIKVLHHKVKKIKGLENLSIWHKLSFFMKQMHWTKKVKNRKKKNIF